MRWDAVDKTVVKLCRSAHTRASYRLNEDEIDIHYCAFHKNSTSKVQKPPLQLRFSLPSIIIMTTSNEPWNTETHKTDQNPPITNHKSWPFEPVKVESCFLRGPLRWLTAAKNAIISWLLNFRICMFVKSVVSGLNFTIMCYQSERVKCFSLQILSDDEKKRHFDMFGTTGRPGNGGQQGSPFYDPHSGFSFFFNGMPFQNAWSRPGQINYRSYHKSVLPESYEKPYLIEIIGDWCFACE